MIIFAIGRLSGATSTRPSLIDGRILLDPIHGRYAALTTEAGCKPALSRMKDDVVVSWPQGCAASGETAYLALAD